MQMYKFWGQLYLKACWLVTGLSYHLHTDTALVLTTVSVKWLSILINRTH